jgi:tetratricopeptide (TPR) repeat protein
MRLAFAGRESGQRWAEELEARRVKIDREMPADGVFVPEGVSLIEVMPDVPHVVMGKVDCTASKARLADRGVQLRAALLGADAVTDVCRRKVNDSGQRTCLVTGWAVRLEDPSVGARLRRQSYTEQVGTLVRRMLTLLVVQAVLTFLAVLFCARLSPLHVATGETPEDALLSAGGTLALVFGWPLMLLALVRLFRWPSLLHAMGLALAVLTCGWIVTLWVVHFVAARSALERAHWWMVLDPVNWIIMIIGAVLCVRAFRLAGDARFLLPPELQIASRLHKTMARGLLGATVVYAVAFLTTAAVSRYRMSEHIIQPGVDAKREHEALLALNQGAEQADRGDVAAAERSCQRALQLWEELTKGPSSPALYRMNLARTLYNLGLLRLKQDRLEQAESYHSRAVSTGEQLLEDPNADAEFKNMVAEARRIVGELQKSKQLAGLDEKDRLANHKYEEAQVKNAQGAAEEADRLFGEAAALWEEVLPKATDPQYRKDALGQLALVYLRQSEVRQRLRKPKESEAALRKSIDHGEKAIAADPDRPLFKHNLQVARQRLDQLLEETHLENIEKLFAAERYGDGIDLCIKGIEEMEQVLRSGKDRESTARRLALRSERFARFLAHCPDPRIRDTRAAVKRASRATELQADMSEYWYTLALVQYRNGDWRDSLASLERVKARDGEFGGGDWLLTAMNRHQLKQKDEARAALRKAVEWMEDQQRKAEENAVLRVQYEMMRPALESLRREAENLIEGKDPTTRGVGYRISASQFKSA